MTGRDGGVTALHLAVRQGNYHALRRLLDRCGFDVNINTPDGWTPLGTGDIAHLGAQQTSDHWPI